MTDLMRKMLGWSSSVGAEGAGEEVDALFNDIRSTLVQLFSGKSSEARGPGKEKKTALLLLPFRGFPYKKHYIILTSQYLP